MSRNVEFSKIKRYRREFIFEKRIHQNVDTGVKFFENHRVAVIPVKMKRYVNSRTRRKVHRVFFFAFIRQPLFF